MASDALAERSRCRVAVLDIQRVHGRGALRALAAVEIVVGVDDTGSGIGIRLYGLRVTAEPDGLAVAAPMYRHDGESRVAVELPTELISAIATAVVSAYWNRADTAAGVH